MNDSKKKSILFVIMALGLVTIVVGLDYEVNTTGAQRKLISNPSLLDTVTRGPIAYATPPYQIDNSGGLGTTYYKRWRSGDGNVYIERLAFSANVWTRSMSITSWTDRATATYVACPR
jgi:hypothetical protein